MNGTPSHHRRRLLGAWALAALLAALVACGDPVPPTVEAPEITAFTATPESIAVGGTSTLAWTIAGSATVALTNGTDPVAIPSGASQVDVSPDATITYTLTATNSGGSDTAQATVVVGSSAPQITSFTATPASIEVGGASTLAWTVVGATSIALSDGTDPVDFAAGATSVVVNPEATTTYTLTATNANGSISFDRMVTVVPAGTTSLSGLSATVVPGSQVRLDWSVLNATSVDVLTVANGDSDDEQLVVSLGGTASTHTFDIPTSARQVLRVCARAAEPADDVCEDETPANVVFDATDYDPYDTAYWRSETPTVPEPTVPGTLRAVMETAAPGSVIGFAADVTVVDLYGVDFYFLAGVGNLDAHLIFDKDLTISGPSSGVVLEGRSGAGPGDPNDGAGGFTYRSRVVYVAPDTDVVLENLTLTGGNFIYVGGGVRNDGTLIARDVIVTGNRAWYEGGGVYNRGTLTFEDGLIDGNTAATLADEVGTTYDIRGDVNARICIYPSGYGGGIWNDPSGVVTLIDTVVSNNVTMISGGGIYNAPGGSIDVTGGTVSGNLGNPDPFVTDPDFTDAPYFVGEPACEDELDLFDPYSIGGGVYNGGVFSLTDGDVLANEVNAAGGGLFINRRLEGTTQLTTLTNVLVQGNVAGVDNPPGFGGGIQHEYFEGDGPANYAPTNVTYGTGNTPSNLTENEIAGPGPAAYGPAAIETPRLAPSRTIRDR